MQNILRATIKWTGLLGAVSVQNVNGSPMRRYETPLKEQIYRFKSDQTGSETVQNIRGYSFHVC
jgi:hypothetical protein